MPDKILYCIALLSAGLAAAPAGAEPLTLDVGETISLQAEAVSLQQVLSELSETLPFTLIERGAALQEPHSFAIEAPNWEAVFKKLLRREGYAAVWREDGQPETLVVYWELIGEPPALAAAAPAATEAVPVFAADDIEARIRAAAAEVLAPDDHAGRVIGTVEAARLKLAELGQALLTAQNAGAPEADYLAAAYEKARAEYLGALQQLENFDEGRSVAALLPAVEEDRDARLRALESLRWLSQTGQNDDAVTAASGAFQSAEDPDVERAALEVLVRYGDRGEVMALLEPLALSDGPNQALAIREWIRIRDEQAAQERSDLEGGPQGKRN